jgi:hypothetical protein
MTSDKEVMLTLGRSLPCFNWSDSCTCTNAILKQITDCFSCSVAKNGGDRDLYQTGMTGEFSLSFLSFLSFLSSQSILPPFLLNT